MTTETKPFPLNAGPLGHIEGITLVDGANKKPILNYFGGVPYALPPVGPYRFRAPRMLPPCYRYGTNNNPAKFTGGTGICPQPSHSRGVPGDPSTRDENCLQSNIYIPQGKAPKGGWPVLFYLHGGFLQWGAPNWTPQALAALYGETAFDSIIVLPAYRLNSLGFLHSKELAAEAKGNGETYGNMGFWDQRLALEWTHKNISLFGGNPSNITVGGYSAGSYSTFHQLAHELYRVPDHKAIIKRAIMFSNSPGAQPKTLDEHQLQFDEYISTLGISYSLSAEEKLKALRQVPHEKLVSVQNDLKISEFRAVSDDVFVPKDIVAQINSGDFAARMKRRGITLLNGENRDEHNLYRNWRIPGDSYEAVRTRLSADYPAAVASKLMHHYCGGTQSLPSKYKNWQHLFGHIYADMQVHCLERGFADALFRGGLQPGEDVIRYRFERRVKCADTFIPPEWDVTHATDGDIWFWGMNHDGGLTNQEKEWLKGWNAGFAAFVRGERVDWGLSKPTDMRRWRSDGGTDVWEDDLWQHGLEVWKVVNGDGGKSRL